MHIKDHSKNLHQLKPGQTARIKELHLDAPMTAKLAAMGIVPGKYITRGAGASPVQVSVSGTEIALGRETAKKIIVSSYKRTFLLTGNPNVGKSVVFSRLTGIGLITSNLPGNTVGLNRGQTLFNGESYDIIDIPGLYRVEEEWTIEGKKHNLLKELEYEFIVCVADAAHLERNLYFLLEILSLCKPVILLLNKFDEAERKGIHIDIKALERQLGIPVIATVATTGEGLKELEYQVARLPVHAEVDSCLLVPPSPEEKWSLIGDIIRRVQRIEHKHPSFWEHLQAWATTPVTGLPIALLVLILSFVTVRFLGEGLIELMTPLYENFYFPFIANVFSGIEGGFVWNILVGDGGQHYFGVLTNGVEIALIEVMPYVLVFYAVLGFLGDLGYLPRLAVLMDGLLHRIGLHGYGAIPIMLGFGCKVPAILGIRMLESRRERIIATALILIMAPCISQTAMIISILAPYGVKYMLLVFGSLVVCGVIAGAFLNRIMKGQTPELFMEIPSWQVPHLRPLAGKLWLRMKEYLADALPLILGGVLLVNLMQASGLTTWLTRFMKYPVEKLLSLPGDVTPVLLLGVLRKDISIALLPPFHLAPEALVVACVFMSMYLPCVATFFVMLRESGVKDTFKIVGLTLALASGAAFVLRLILL